MDDRRKLLEAYSKQLQQGNPLAEDFVNTSKSPMYQSVQARNLAEDALANEVLKNTGIPVPDNSAPRLKKEDFLNRIIAERYPELSPDVSLNNQMKGLDGAYLPEGKILVKDNKDLLKMTGTGLHEAGHQYDDKILNFDGKDVTNKTKIHAPAGRIIQDIDPMQMSEIMNKGHHARIPNLRDADSYGLGALKSMMKSGEFKSTSSPLSALMQSLETAYKPDVPPSANPAAQAKIAEAYAQMKHDPNNPEVKKAYEALASEIEQQYGDLQKDGMKVSKIGDKLPNPYKNSKDLIKDATENKHMAYFPTEAGYGAGVAADAAQDSPMLRASKFLDADGKPMPVNDLFRVVHDYQGHVKGENKFGATGEERAFQQHRQTLSPEAQKALATETRGQNSWVNYGPEGEANRKNPANTVFAEQKTGLLPKWATEDLEKVESPNLHRLGQLGKYAARLGAPLALASGIVPLAADLKEGKPNTALARAVGYAAPMGAEQLQEQLEETARIKDTSPELTDPGYLRTLKNIGERRVKEGRSPIVESFSGQKVDTSATEGSEFENKIKALQRLNSQG